VLVGAGGAARRADPELQAAAGQVVDVTPILARTPGCRYVLPETTTPIRIRLVASAIAARSDQAP
jgi:hypothetical protein